VRVRQLGGVLRVAGLHPRRTVFNTFPQPPGTDERYGISMRRVPYLLPPASRQVVSARLPGGSAGGSVAAITSRALDYVDGLVEVEVSPRSILHVKRTNAHRKPRHHVVDPRAALQVGTQTGRLAEPLEPSMVDTAHVHAFSARRESNRTGPTFAEHPVWSFWWVAGDSVRMMSAHVIVEFVSENVAEIQSQLATARQRFACTRAEDFEHHFTEHRTCSRQPLDQLRLNKVVWQYLWRCMNSENCGAVEFSIERDSANMTARLKVSEMLLDLYPVARNPRTANISSDVTLFLKKADAVSQDVFENNAGLLKRLKRSLDRTFGKQAFQPLLVMQAPSGCRCDPSSCMEYRDHGGRWRGWCRIVDAMLQRCKRAHIQVYRSKDAETHKDFLWSHDLCSSSCVCSGVGVASGVRAEGNVTAVEIGDRCTDADAPGREKWCNVGVDSICPDRSKSRGVFREVEVLVRQFTSELACARENDAARIQYEAGQTCSMILGVSRTLVLVLAIVYIVTGYLLVPFLQNRCGDYVRMEDQFQVTFDSDEDDWFAGAFTTKRSGLAPKGAGRGG